MPMLSKNRQQPSKRPQKLLKKPISKLNRTEKPEKPSKLLLTRKPWLREEPNSSRNSEMSGPLAQLEFPTCK